VAGEDDSAPDGGAPAGGEPRAEDLSDELARKWDPERLLGMVSTRAGKGQQLDASLRNRYERKFGVDLSHVRIYTGEFAEEFNKQRNANAVTIGSTGMILMGGHADKAMHTAEGAALLAHELAHVAQAQRGLFRQARMAEAAPLATEEAEEEAEAAEHAELAEHQGGAAPAAAAEAAADKDAKKLVDEVTAKVKEMLGEAGRIWWMRNGMDPRRP
jgi:Domain of unknown function (DUF4157)